MDDDRQTQPATTTYLVPTVRERVGAPYPRTWLRTQVENVAGSTLLCFLGGALTSSITATTGLLVFAMTPKHERLSLQHEMHLWNTLARRNLGFWALGGLGLQSAIIGLRQWRGKDDRWNLWLAMPPASAITLAQHGPKGALGGFLLGAGMIMGVNWLNQLPPLEHDGVVGTKKIQDNEA